MDARQQASSRIETVLGPVDPVDAGMALIHEHVLFDLTCLYSALSQGPPSSWLEGAEEGLSLALLGWTRMHPYNSMENLKCSEIATAIAELERYKLAGGGLIADVSNVSIGRNPQGLRRAAEATGVHIVMGCGYYVAKSHPPELDKATVEELANEMIADITIGVDDTGIRAGVIGELGLSDPGVKTEHTCIEAAAMAQQETGCAIVMHSPAGPQGPFQAASLLEQAGADPTRTVISHVDARFGEEIDSYRRLADHGFVLGLDTFGRDIYIDFMKLQLPNDSARIRAVKALCDAGMREQLVLAQDICLKMELCSFGGYGYGHLLENLWSRFLDAGLAEKDLLQVLQINPVRLLTVTS
ncbi:MAG: hypothetical protein WD314_09480 [Trueperaceae bacterium]